MTVAARLTQAAASFALEAFGPIESNASAAQPGPLLRYELVDQRGEYARDTIWIWIRLAQGSLSKTRWIQFWADREIQVEVLAASVIQSSFGPTTVNGG